MFNLIRRIAAWAERHPRPSAGRHRRHLSASPAAAVLPEPQTRITVPRQRRPQEADLIWADDSTLVRPYVLSGEERRQYRSDLAGLKPSTSTNRNRTERT
ncbi:hypothetical protein [Streptomyces sp. GC420]|uniref:hypothetical protein n=1 Tax=Streptomyces sp. GC420 TaxID=2697568 RepID=UPI0014150361|nr:hypothetical protein [Streptomyces sp. GC420]NBM17490.1 hypothetical protein [Streptomyces sp. GC420]